jgi:hypothetical protein
MRPVLADALRSEPEIAATLRTVFAGGCAVEVSMSDVSESGWVVSSSYLAGWQVATLQCGSAVVCVYVAKQWRQHNCTKRCGI